ncbi:LOB domain-containing protein 24-like [Iris pallida]|uniref:LOB domain-containing protein 24-like n=1 Tax=Iris pallida TaxID=29817 RepID=A0AAX6FIY7_IRIPA|nr:LOB domain-containing protein 24-like [Iris pallida]KAJ6850814.1 LOB domain-containing protein 24-like [Iris pallida]
MPRCARCAEAKRKCRDDCVLKPYFPEDNPKRFKDVKTVYGIKIVEDMLNNNPIEVRQQLADSISADAKMRVENPIGGCYSVLCEREREIQLLKETIVALENERNQTGPASGASSEQQVHPPSQPVQMPVQTPVPAQPVQMPVQTPPGVSGATPPGVSGANILVVLDAWMREGIKQLRSLGDVTNAMPPPLISSLGDVTNGDELLRPMPLPLISNNEQQRSESLRPLPPTQIPNHEQDDSRSVDGQLPPLNHEELRSDGSGTSPGDGSPLPLNYDSGSVDGQLPPLNHEHLRSDGSGTSPGDGHGLPLNHE